MHGQVTQMITETTTALLTASLFVLLLEEEAEPGVLEQNKEKRRNRRTEKKITITPELNWEEVYLFAISTQHTTHNTGEGDVLHLVLTVYPS